MLVFPIYLKNVVYADLDLHRLCSGKVIMLVREPGGGKQLYEIGHSALAVTSAASPASSSVFSSLMTGFTPPSGEAYEKQYEQCLVLDNMRITAKQYQVYLFLKTMINTYYDAVEHCLWHSSLRYVDDVFSCLNHIEPFSVWECLENTESPLTQQERECINNTLHVAINFATCEAHYAFYQPSSVLEEMMGTLEGTYGFLDPM